MTLRPAPRGVAIRRTPMLTFGLGGTVLLSWLIVRGPSVFNGVGPFMHPTWVTAWVVGAGMAVAVGLVAGWLWERDMPPPHILAVVVAAWVGELLVLFAITPILAGELTLLLAPYLWLIATGGVIQPLAAMSGVGLGVMARRLSQALPHVAPPDIPTSPSHR